MTTGRRLMGGKIKVGLFLLMCLAVPLGAGSLRAEIGTRPAEPVKAEVVPPETAEGGRKKQDNMDKPTPKEGEVGRRAIDAHAQKSLVDRIKSCCKDGQK